jgi:fucose 4-O-acetylase-like acetyltransferase
MRKGEIYFINYMKFFGIIYLLIWHTGILKINVFVIQFFLQMFIFISGYFYKEKYTLSPFLFLKKRIYSLYLPYIIYCTLFLLFNNIFVDLQVYNSSMYLNNTDFNKQFFQIVTLQQNLQMAGAMWFVAALFLVSILFLVISILTELFTFQLNHSSIKERFRFFLVSIFYFIGHTLAMNNHKLPALLDISLVIVPFYYLGYLYKKYEKEIPVSIFLALPMFILLTISMEYGFPQIIQRKYVDPSTLLSCGIAGIYLNIYIALRSPTHDLILNFINFTGRNTMAILALHFLAFKVMSLLIIQYKNLPMSLLSSFPVIKQSGQFERLMYVCAGLLLPLAGVYLCNNIYRMLISAYIKINGLFK